MHHVGPGGEIAGASIQGQQAHGDLIHALFGEHQRNFVDALDVLGGDDRLNVHVAEQRDLFLHLLRDGTFAAAQQDIRLDTDGAQLFHAMLRRFGLELLRGRDPGNQRDVNKQRIVPAEFVTKLPNRLKEG
jgi:hypothetical protein